MTDPGAAGLAIWGVRGGPPGGTPETEWYDYLGQPIATMGQSGGFKVYGDQICVYPGGDVSWAVAALIMSASTLLPVGPLDGAQLGKAGVVAAAGVVGGALLGGFGAHLTRLKARCRP